MGNFRPKCANPVSVEISFHSQHGAKGDQINLITEGRDRAVVSILPHHEVSSATGESMVEHTIEGSNNTDTHRGGPR